MTRPPTILPSRRSPRVVVPLRLATLYPCDDVVECLEGMLERAKSGHVRAVAIAAVTTDRGVGTSFAYGDADWRLLGFAVHHLDVRTVG